MNLGTAKKGDTQTSEAIRVNVIANGFGFSRTIPVLGYAGDDRTEDVMKAVKAFRAKGFEVHVARVTEVVEKL